MSTWGGILVAAAIIIATAIGFLLRRRSGRFQEAAPTTRPNPVLEQLGVMPGTPVTLLQFSSAFCAPCRTTRVLCADVAERTPGVRHIEVDAESHVDAVRALDIWRTPTVLLIDHSGEIRRRASGAPSREQLRTAVAAVLNPDLGSDAAAG